MTEADKKKPVRTGVNLGGIADILQKHGVVVGYLFGSAVRGAMGPHSDIDLGVVFESEFSAEDDFNRRMKLAEEVSRVFNVPDTDIINLKTARGPLIKYQAVFGGELILEKDKEMRFAVEREIVRDYEDTRELRRIRSSVLHEELLDDTFGRASSKILT